MLEPSPVTRRFALRAMGLAGAGWAARGAAAATAFALRGDESHNSDYIRTALTHTLKRSGTRIDFTDQEKLLTYDSLRQYKILIMFRDGLASPTAISRQVYWNEKKNNMVSVPPLAEETR